MILYVAVVALSLPGAAVMSIAGGFLFGWVISVPATVVAATTGAVIVFEIVRTSFGSEMAKRAGSFTRRLSDGFCSHGFSYLLFLRLVPAFPFFAVNAVAGLCRLPLVTFIAATAIGIIPGAIAFAWIGSGLDSLFDAQAETYRRCVASGGPACSYELELHALVTPDILLAFAGLGVLALLPIGVRYLRHRRTA
jgi:uncharacterized membrane protein YdjX (TVP38/TMEM64 family)